MAEQIPEIIKDKWGEVVYLSSEFYPPICMYFKDKKLLKSEEVLDIISFSKKLFSKLKKENSDTKLIDSLGKDILEIAICEDGSLIYSFKP